MPRPPAACTAPDILLDQLAPQDILNAMGDGVYVTDLDRRIVYWSDAAARMTGWTNADVLGRGCKEDILCHEDKDGRKLCGKDTCPLWRAMATGRPGAAPALLYAQRKDGSRMPVQVTVSPVRDRAGAIVGGVEVFRDYTTMMHDLTRARRIQRQSLTLDMPGMPGLRCDAHYIPHDLVGGDFYAVEQRSDTQCAFILADMMGHGVSAALHTMYLRSIWQEHSGACPDPTAFARVLNAKLHALLNESSVFAAALCGMIDTQADAIHLVGAAHPSPFLFSRDGAVRRIDTSGLPMGLDLDAVHAAATYPFRPGDTLFLYTDGALGAADALMTEQDVLDVLLALGYPRSETTLPDIENALLARSGNLALGDDLTFLAFRRP
ncbi:MAG: SpoIIE family protein phosphatase [Desulfovibrionaceae bacterium]